MKINRKTLILTTLVCLLPILAGALLYSRLPETVPTHFNLNGEPDGWSSRAVAAFALPALMLVMNFVLQFALNADPKRQNMSGALMKVVVWTVPVLSVLCSGMTLAKALGYNVRIEVVLPVFMGLLFILIGNYLPKTKQSYTMGIRLPWTLSSEENWNRTHRLAGFLWVLCGVLFIVMSFIGWSLPLFLILLAVMIPCRRCIPTSSTAKGSDPARLHGAEACRRRIQESSCSKPGFETGSVWQCTIQSLSFHAFYRCSIHEKNLSSPLFSSLLSRNIPAVYHECVFFRSITL